MGMEEPADRIAAARQAARRAAQARGAVRLRRGAAMWAAAQTANNRSCNLRFPASAADKLVRLFEHALGRQDYHWFRATASRQHGQGAQHDEQQRNEPPQVGPVTWNTKARYSSIDLPPCYCAPAE